MGLGGVSDSGSAMGLGSVADSGSAMGPGGVSDSGSAMGLGGVSDSGCESLRGTEVDGAVGSAATGGALFGDECSGEAVCTVVGRGRVPQATRAAAQIAAIGSASFGTKAGFMQS